MSTFGTVVIFTIAWWISFIAVLPWGIQSQLEVGMIERGTEPGAPHRPRLLIKIGAATLLAAILTAIMFFGVDRGWFAVLLEP